MASIQKMARQLLKNVGGALIRKIELSGKRQSIEQSLKSRNTKWNPESFFQAVLSDTSTLSAILF